MSLVELGGGSTGFERDLLCVVVSMSVGGGGGVEVVLTANMVGIFAEVRVEV